MKGLLERLFKRKPEIIQLLPHHYDLFADMANVEGNYWDIAERFVTERIDNDLRYGSFNERVRRRYVDGASLVIKAIRENRAVSLPSENYARGDIFCQRYCFRLGRPLENFGCDGVVGVLLLTEQLNKDIERFKIELKRLSNR